MKVLFNILLALIFLSSANLIFTSDSNNSDVLEKTNLSNPLQILADGNEFVKKESIVQAYNETFQLICNTVATSNKKIEIIKKLPNEILNLGKISAQINNQISQVNTNLICKDRSKLYYSLSFPFIQNAANYWNNYFNPIYKTIKFEEGQLNNKILTLIKMFFEDDPSNFIDTNKLQKMVDTKIFQSKIKKIRIALIYCLLNLGCTLSDYLVQESMRQM